MIVLIIDFDFLHISLVIGSGIVVVNHFMSLKRLRNKTHFLLNFSSWCSRYFCFFLLNFIRNSEVQVNKYIDRYIDRPQTKIKSNQSLSSLFFIWY
jgi:hypothetical protein